MNVALIGASADASKYAHMALLRLEAAGHRVFPVNPSLPEIGGRKVYASIADVPAPVHTVTMYVSKRVSDGLEKDLFAASPKRIVFNPGAENPRIFDEAIRRGVEAVDGCTLVMLSTGSFGA